VDRTRTFAVILEAEEEGGVTGRVPSVPEIATCGKDEAEALPMAEDAIRLVLEDRRLAASRSRAPTRHPSAR
jgi:antitoxin HicB